MLFAKKTNRAASLITVFFFILSLVITNLLVIVPAHADTQAIYYIDPVTGNDDNNGTSTATAFRTIQKTRDVVRTINSNMTGDIIIYLRGGDFNITETITFTQNDSGTNGHKVMYKAYEGETPVISGGYKTTGWTLYDSGNNIYRSDAVSGGIETRQLYVDGVRATRARSSAEDLSGLTFVSSIGYTAAGAYTVDGIASSIHNWGNEENRGDIEFVYRKIWTNPRCGISTITSNGSTTTITMDSPGWTFVKNKGATSVGYPSMDANGTVWYIENAYELIDTEGEWYLDRSTDRFYYKPHSWEDMSRVEVIAPIVEKLVTIEGSSLDTPAHDIEFYGITFHHSTWLRPNTTSGLPDAQSCIIREYIDEETYSDEFLTAAAVDLKTAKSILFERCEFSKLGAAAIGMILGCQDNMVRGCRIYDVSGNGIQVGEVDMKNANNYNPTDARYILKNIDIVNNYIHHVGVEYRSGVAVNGAYTEDLNVSHNEIAQLSYSGVTIGWAWSEFPTTCNKLNKVQNNYIHETMLQLVDGGSIYVMGTTSGSTSVKGTISGNYLKNTVNPYGTIYPDEGSSWYDITNNVVENAYRYLHIHTGSIHDINTNYTYTNTADYLNNGTNCIVSNTTVVTGGNWPDAALEIMGNAGIEPEYMDIRDPDPVNIALNKTATAHTSWTGCPASNAIDNDTGTLWASASGDTDIWWQVDLGSEYRITGTELVSRQDATDQPSARCNYTVQASKDSNFSSYVTLGTKNNSSFYGYKGMWEFKMQNSDTYRYVRVKRTADYLDDHFNFSEFKVFGDKNVSQSKTTGSSSDWGAGMESNKAVDGSLTAIWASASGDTDATPWWSVDLGSAHRINTIQIVSRQDYDDAAVRRNFTIQASNSSNFSTYITLAIRNGNAYNYKGTYNLDVLNSGTYRYVRIIRIAGLADHHINFAECKIFGMPNVAFGKTTNSSSYWSAGLEASRAVDETLSTIWASASSDTDATPWWTVDMGSAYQISKIQIVSRQDQDQPDCRRNFTVQASNDVNFSTFITIGSQGGYSYPYKGTWERFINNINTYRYIRILRTGTSDHHLNFAECRVFSN